MTEHNHQSFFYVIPAKLIEDSPSPYSGYLYGLITSLCSKEGYCWATNEFFAEKLNLKPRSIRTYLKYLKETGWIIIDPQKELGNKRKIYINQPGLWHQTSEPMALERHTPTALKCHHSNINKSNIKNNVQRSQSDAAEPTKKDLFFSIKEQRFVGITDDDKQKWRIAFPSINLEQELMKAEEWLRANPTKSKLKKKFRDYIRNWLTKAETYNANKIAYASSTGKEKQVAPIEDLEIIKEIHKEYRKWYEQVNDPVLIDKGFLIMDDQYFYDSSWKEFKCKISLEKMISLLENKFKVPSYFMERIYNLLKQK